MSALLLIVSAAAATVPGGAAGTGERQKATVLMAESERARQFQEETGYSDAVIAGDTIYLSGIVAGMAPGQTDMKPAYDRVYKQIGSVLKRAGASWDDVVDMTSFHTDVEGQLPAMSAVHKQYVKPPFPAWTAIGVSKVLGNGITEIKVTAKRPGGASAGK